MLDIKIDKTKKQAVVIQASGEMQEVINEVGLIISDLYHSMAKRDPMTAAAFKWAITKITDPETGPVWKKDGTNGPGTVTMVLQREKE